MWNVDPAKPIYRLLFVIFGIMFLAFGLAALKTTLLSYRNSWGDLVFGAFVIIFGLVFIIGALYKPNIFK
jgi:uncharacterized membrane protein HdeD (DUF308 family)